MRKIIVAAFFIVLYFSVNAQSDSVFAVAEYSFSHLDDTTQPDFPRRDQMKLYIGKKMSLYVDYDQMNAVMAQSKFSGGRPMSELKKSALRGGYFKDIQNSQVTFIAPAGLNTYVLEEKIPVIDWVITQETKDIKGLHCQKATCLFRGRNYEAWFCSQLPYSNGPWKLGGLPGLIVEAYDIHKDVQFMFIGFENTSDIAVIEIPSGIEKKTAKEYQQYREALYRDSNAMTGVASGGNVFIGQPAGGSATSGRHTKQINNPLEKETKKDTGQK